MIFIDLFAGIGGFRLGFEKNKKYKCLWANEIDKYACKIYRKNFGDNELVEEDIREISAESIPCHDLLTAGFPCQAFSIAGKRKGFNDTRGTLFFEICRITKVKRPTLLLLENVKGLLNHKKGETFRIILDSLSELGYDCEWEVLNSKNFGVPQNRERVFIIGHLREQSRPKVFPIREADEIHTKSNRKVSHAIDSNYHKGYLNNQQRTFIKIHNMQPRSPDRPSLKYSAGGSGHLSRKDIAYCVDTGFTNAIELNNYSIRRLTPTECERLQGFPDGWTEGISDTQRYKCLGNAVTTNVVTEIGKRIARVQQEIF